MKELWQVAVGRTDCAEQEEVAAEKEFREVRNGGRSRYFVQNIVGDGGENAEGSKEKEGRRKKERKGRKKS